ncbi:hypothetical protein EOL96_01040 [Candidatus Saccharibacteria bacterium]|nr:hypothetical protein [Candidatus Saccharibacteria bacterium]
MNIYFSGIGGVGIGPLAEIAYDAEYGVCGSDPAVSPMTQSLANRGITVSQDQTGEHLRKCHEHRAIDWFVHTAALPTNHPELHTARELGLHIAKRDELINLIVTEKDLRLVAVAGTHGKTSASAMFVWVLQQLGIPASYSVGAPLGFAPSGHLDPHAEYFVYECDEFDKNFLHFTPYLSLITSIDYDHPDTYPTAHEYASAFTQFIAQSHHTILWQHDLSSGTITHKDAWVLQDDDSVSVSLPGVHNRANATLVAKACEYLSIGTNNQIIAAIESFPGAARRFEKLAKGIYSDYGHHPTEIAATLQLAREMSPYVLLVYQPHQNTRQHQVRNDYTTCMSLAKEIIWLPTYLSREDESLPVLSPQDLTQNLANKESVRYGVLDDTLWRQIKVARDKGMLVLCMGAGNIDNWIRDKLSNE